MPQAALYRNPPACRRGSCTPRGKPRALSRLRSSPLPGLLPRNSRLVLPEEDVGFRTVPLPPRRSWVIVDQAEELITLCGETEREDFLGLLASALDADPRLWIILILRERAHPPTGAAQWRTFAPYQQALSERMTSVLPDRPDVSDPEVARQAVGYTWERSLDQPSADGLPRPGSARDYGSTAELNLPIGVQTWPQSIGVD
ncbi:MAG TPA: hypothetical protein VFQ77_18165 [Pseudonocardiaceae bacterium]|nr:hypothetical protein [Pseudonocardiaceae bacterium]